MLAGFRYASKYVASFIFVQCPLLGGRPLVLGETGVQTEGDRQNRAGCREAGQTDSSVSGTARASCKNQELPSVGSQMALAFIPGSWGESLVLRSTEGKDPRFQT